MGERNAPKGGRKEADLDEENITLEQCCSVVITNEGVTWMEFLRHYIRIFGVVNYKKLESFVHSNCPEHFVHDRGQYYSRKYFYSRPVYFWRLHEELRPIIKSAHNHAKSDDQKFRISYKKLKHLFAQNFMFDFYTTKFDLFCPSELLLLLPGIVEVEVDEWDVQVAISREVDISRDEMEVVFGINWLLYQNNGAMLLSETLQKLVENRCENVDEAQCHLNVAIYENILKKHKALFEFFDADDNVIVSFSKKGILVKLTAMILVGYTGGVVSKLKVLHSLNSQYNQHTSVEEMDAILAHNPRIFHHTKDGKIQLMSVRLSEHVMEHFEAVVDEFVNSESDDSIQTNVDANDVQTMD